MTKRETLEMLVLIQTAYPRFYQSQSSDDLKNVLELWAKMFEKEDYKVAMSAIDSLIGKLEFPPTIADVKKEIAKLTSTATNESTGIDEWNLIRQAIKNSAYGAKEEFDRLPPIARRFVGSPSQLHDWAISYDFNADVVRGQFMKQYDVLKEREEYKKMLEKSDLKDILTKSSMKAIEGVTNE